MESIIVACITGVVTLIGVILSNSKNRAVMEVKLDALTAKVEKHNSSSSGHTAWKRGFRSCGTTSKPSGKGGLT